MGAASLTRGNEDHVWRSVAARLARYPWPLVWWTFHKLSGTALGKRWLDRLLPGRSRKCDILRQICQQLGLTEKQTQLECQRLYDTALNRVLMAQLPRLSKEALQRRYLVEGWQHFADEHSAGRPVILAGSHFGVGRVFPAWLARQGIRVLSIEGVDELELMGASRPEGLLVRVNRGEFTAQHLLEALRVMGAGGCVHITGDHLVNGQQRSRTMRWCGFEVDYPLGLPTLSLLSGAVIVPYFVSLIASGSDRGRVRVEFKPKITPPSSRGLDPTQRQDAILALSEEYARVLMAESEKTPGNLFRNLSGNHERGKPPSRSMRQRDGAVKSDRDNAG